MHLGGTKPRSDLNCTWTEFLAVCRLSAPFHTEGSLGPDSYDLLSLNPKKVGMAGHLLVTLPLIAMRVLGDNFSLCKSAAVYTQGFLQLEDAIPWSPPTPSFPLDPASAGEVGG